MKAHPDDNGQLYLPFAECLVWIALLSVLGCFITESV